MTTSTPEALLEALTWRYAVKRFDSTRRIPEPAWQALKESLRLAPSSFGLEPWRFIEVASPSIRSQLPALSWNQTQPVDADRYVVFAQRDGLSPADAERLVQATAEARGKSLDSLAGFHKMLLGAIESASQAGTASAWNARQVYIALGFSMLGAAVLGIDSCPMEGIDPAGYDRLLGLPGSGYKTVCACAFGYRAADDKYAQARKVRRPDGQVWQVI